MPEITLADLITWESRVRPLALNGLLPNGRHDEVLAEPWAERELSWVVTVRASAPMLPSLRGGELVLLPSRVLAETGVGLPVLLREMASLGAAGVVLDAPPPHAAPVPVFLADAITPDLESELNRLLTERRGEFYRAGTELSRVLTTTTAVGANLADVLATAADFLATPAAIVDARGNVVAATAPAAVPVPASGSPPGGRGWRDDRFGLRLAGGETLWLGPVVRPRRALVRLAGERVAVAAEAALVRAADARPRGPARSAAIGALLTAPAADAQRAALTVGLPANGVYRVVLTASEVDASSLQRSLAPFGTVHEAGSLDRAGAALIELRAEGAGSAVLAGPRTNQPRRRDLIAPRETPAKGWLAFSGPANGTVALPAAAREARFVAALLTGGLIAGPIGRFDVLADLGAYRLLYRLWGSPELATYTADALGDLATRDRRGTLRRTLLAYLDAGGSHVDAAARLGIHRNTLSYRLKQIASLTRCEPTDPSTHLVLHLALLAASLPPAPEA
jgi:PucR family transcriptional regulator, purine catabolism regulatory protein